MHTCCQSAGENFDALRGTGQTRCLPLHALGLRSACALQICLQMAPWVTASSNMRSACSRALPRRLRPMQGSPVNCFPKAPTAAAPILSCQQCACIRAKSVTRQRRAHCAALLSSHAAPAAVPAALCRAAAREPSHFRASRSVPRCPAISARLPGTACKRKAFRDAQHLAICRVAMTRLALVALAACLVIAASGGSAARGCRSACALRGRYESGRPNPPHPHTPRLPSACRAAQPEVRCKAVGARRRRGAATAAAAASCQLPAAGAAAAALTPAATPPAAAQTCVPNNGTATGWNAASSACVPCAERTCINCQADYTKCTEVHAPAGARWCRL